MIEKQLSKEYVIKGKIYLPETGKAHEIAKQISGVNTHQLRKVLDVSKDARRKAQDGDVNTAISMLFQLVPLTAYAAGRSKASAKDDGDLKGLYDFISSHINVQSIRDKEDIIVFDELVTSIVAFHKYEKAFNAKQNNSNKNSHNKNSNNRGENFNNKNGYKGKKY